jgi:hypothetical protein
MADIFGILYKGANCEQIVQEVAAVGISAGGMLQGVA